MWGYPEQFMPVPGSEYHRPALAGVQRAAASRPVPVAMSPQAQEG
jgi:hypothetical protein